MGPAASGRTLVASATLKNMRHSLILVFSFYVLTTLSQTRKLSSIKTLKYAGKYTYGENAEKGPVGSIFIYPESDSTILFFIDISRGAPSYNMGQMYDRLIIVNNKGYYSSNVEGDEKGCKWLLTIENKVLTIETLDESHSCGFGGNVYADNHYKLKSNKIPKYFIDGHNHKVFFSKTSPEHYQN
jgi:hypothetical protein